MRFFINRAQRQLCLLTNVMQYINVAGRLLEHFKK